MSRKSKNKNRNKASTADSTAAQAPTTEAETNDAVDDDVIDHPDHVDRAPQSVTYMWINALAFAVSVGVWFVFQDNPDFARRHLALLCGARAARGLGAACAP